MSQKPIPPPPRDVLLIPLRKDPQHLGYTIAGIIFLLVSTIQGTVFTWFAQPWIDLALDRAGHTTSGELLETGIVSGEHYGGTRPLRFTYRFQPTEGGPTVEGSSKTIAPGLVAAGPDGQVQVEYLPSRPHWNRVQNTRFSLFPRWALAVPLFFFLVGLAFLRGGVGARARIRRVLEQGEETTGVVLTSRQLWYMKHSRTGQRAHRVTFEYRHGDGRRRTGSVDTFNETAAALVPGSQLRLLVLRLRPQQVVAYDLLDLLAKPPTAGAR